MTLIRIERKHDKVKTVVFHVEAAISPLHAWLDNNSNLSISRLLESTIVSASVLVVGVHYACIFA